MSPFYFCQGVTDCNPELLVGSLGKPRLVNGRERKFSSGLHIEGNHGGRGPAQFVAFNSDG